MAQMEAKYFVLARFYWFVRVQNSIKASKPHNDWKIYYEIFINATENRGKNLVQSKILLKIFKFLMKNSNKSNFVAKMINFTLLLLCIYTSTQCRELNSELL